RSLLRLHIQGLDEISADQSCGTKILNVASGTDLLVVRRTSTCKAGPTADPDCDTSAPYLQATSCEAVLLSTVATDLYKLDSTPGNLTLTKRDCVTVADYRGFRTHVYYVSPNDQSGDGIPTLKVANLSGDDYSVTPLVEGIEQLQIEYGIDTSGDGLPDSFTSSP